jgi:hypothetical protein
VQRDCKLWPVFAVSILLGAAGQTSEIDRYPEFRFNPDVPMLPSVAKGRPDPWLWLSNQRVKVGVNLDYGGSVCWISKAGSDFNMVNWFDPGRQIQTSYFGHDGFPQQVRGGPGPKEGGAYRIWNWNPVQAGDARGNRSPVIGFKEEPNHIWTRCQPLNWGGMAAAVSLRGKWDPRPAPAEAFMDMDLTLDGPAVKLTFGFTYWGKDSRGICNFEMPAVYVNAPLDRYWSYRGSRPWTMEPPEDLTSQVPPDMTIQQFRHEAGEHWGAWTDKARFGITTFQPDTTRFSAGTFYPRGAPEFANKPLDAHWGQVTENHYLAAWRKFPIDQWHSRYEWDLYLIVAELGEAREIITKKLREGPKIRAAGPRQVD